METLSTIETPEEITRPVIPLSSRELVRWARVQRLSEQATEIVCRSSELDDRSAADLLDRLDEISDLVAEVLR